MNSPRCGKDRKVVITGDLDRIDQPCLDATSNCPACLISRFIKEANFSYFNLTVSARSALADSLRNSSKSAVSSLPSAFSRAEKGKSPIPLFR